VGDEVSDVSRTEVVHAEALGTLACWLDGYTTPEEGPQLRIRPAFAGDDYLNVVVEECVPFPDNPREFRITVTVEEL
jgi:hypothetical protein